MAQLLPLPQRPELFAPARHVSTASKGPARPAFVSFCVHAALFVLAVWLTSGGTETAPMEDGHDTSRLIFLVSPGPGGGGGGGGLRVPRPAAIAERRGDDRSRVSVPPVTPDPVETVARRDPAPVPPPEPVPVKAPDPLPSTVLVAPVVNIAGDNRNRDGIIDVERQAESEGPGAGGGAGSGHGAGSGEGEGSGIGPGSGGGTGGGPYRAGSGIEAPRLLREVKADYTDEARRRNLTGDVVLEIVVLRDGRVGDITLLRGLGAGLDERAIASVRQWQFAPARRMGRPVDVIVEVAVEFSLR